MLLAAAQVHRGLVAILDMQTNGILVELAAGIQIHHIKNNMAGADDVERRIEHVLRDGHTKSLLSKSLAPHGEEVSFRQRVPQDEATPSRWILCVPRASETCLVSM